MNKTELVASIAEKTALTNRDSERVLAAALDAITESLQNGESVQINGFGTFEVRERAERLGRNPQTGQEIRIPATRTPVLKFSRIFREAVK